MLVTVRSTLQLCIVRDTLVCQLELDLLLLINIEFCHDKHLILQIKYAVDASLNVLRSIQGSRINQRELDRVCLLTSETLSFGVWASCLLLFGKMIVLWLRAGDSCI